jgi:hypothetical protein
MGVKDNSNSFEMVRLSKAKREVDLSSNTIRAYAKQGLALYRKGRAVFFSREELSMFIRSTSEKQALKQAA